MKLQTITTYWFVAALLLLISLWAAIFYFALLDEIYDSIDDGLENQKQLIIQKASSDSSVFSRDDFAESNYIIKQLTATEGLNFYDRYIDTTMYMQNEDDYEPVRLLTTVFTHNNKYYQLQVATSMVEEDDLIAELLYSLLWLFLGLVLSIILLNKLLLGRIWNSFYHLLHQLRNYKLDSQEVIKVKDSRIEEFQLLNENIKALLKRTKETFNSQKQFIENASHELQTPLAISINKLETLAEKNNLSAEDMQLLSGALDNLDRMTRLNRSLLLLTRIENKQFPDTELVDLSLIVQKLAEDFSDQADFSDIHISVKEQQPCTIKMNQDLATIMISNLIKNAIVHNYKGGTIDIKIDAQSLLIENTGDHKPLDEATIFTRFYKQHPSSSSTGLGLAIVKAIADMYGYKIDYNFSGNKHQFILQFI